MTVPKHARPQPGTRQAAGGFAFGAALATATITAVALAPVIGGALVILLVGVGLQAAALVEAALSAIQ